MKEVYYVYNNEALASCVFLSILDKIESIDIARSCLILPFLLDDKTVSFIKKNNSSESNLEHLVNINQRLFASFNKRYLSLLPISINSLIILKKGEQLYVNDNIIRKSNTKINIDVEELGDRFSKLREVIPVFLSLIENYSTNQLYRILKVQL
ncbi:three component ABC system middle component [Flavobacterium sp. LB3P21]|uniref:three component ABC system middle component n=1 Tax=Flavobacterium sp. LB3P21 TaxID=3401719 RepID=UPI003AAD2EFE